MINSTKSTFWATKSTNRSDRKKTYKNCGNTTRTSVFLASKRSTKTTKNSADSCSISGVRLWNLTKSGRRECGFATANSMARRTYLTSNRSKTSSSTRHVRCSYSKENSTRNANSTRQTPHDTLNPVSQTPKHAHHTSVRQRLANTNSVYVHRHIPTYLRTETSNNIFIFEHHSFDPIHPIDSGYKTGRGGRVRRGEERSLVSLQRG